MFRNMNKQSFNPLEQVVCAVFVGIENLQTMTLMEDYARYGGRKDRGITMEATFRKTIFRKCTVAKIALEKKAVLNELYIQIVETNERFANIVRDPIMAVATSVIDKMSKIVVNDAAMKNVDELIYRL